MIVIGLACGGETVKPFTAAEVKTPSDGLCIPAAALRVTPGESWVLRGRVRLDGGGPGEPPVLVAVLATTYTVAGFDDTQLDVDGRTVVVKRSTVHVTIQLEQSTLRGRWLSTQQKEIAGSTVAVSDLAPALTLDWDCHRQAWLDGNEAPAQADGAEFTVEDTVLDSGLEVVLFVRKADLNVPEQMRSGVVITGVGYDKRTGRLVLRMTEEYGIEGEDTFANSTVHELVVEE